MQGTRPRVPWRLVKIDVGVALIVSAQHEVAELTGQRNPTVIGWLVPVDDDDCWMVMIRAKGACVDIVGGERHRNDHHSGGLEDVGHSIDRANDGKLLS